jgi:uncharacterized protein YbjT (DUF2867 family)
MLAVTAATGKIGGATLDALLTYNLIPASDIIVLSSSPLDSPKVASIASRGVSEVRRANYADRAAVTHALRGCDRLFLVSTPETELDYNDAPPGKGREQRHINAIEAAMEAGVKHVYYTSLGFKNDSKAGVMRAHLRTEAHLKQQTKISYTIIREGLYSESWPLYFGHFASDGKETRQEFVVSGDGEISWTSVADLGLATARIITDQKHDANETVFLSQRKTMTLKEIAHTLGRQLRVVSDEEYVQHYIKDHGMDEPFLRWWVSTYPSLAAGHCRIDDPLLESLLGRDPESFSDYLKITQ